jgi:hypothetical protein
MRIERADVAAMGINETNDGRWSLTLVLRDHQVVDIPEPTEELATRLRADVVAGLLEAGHVELSDGYVAHVLTAQEVAAHRETAERVLAETVDRHRRKHANTN